MLTLSTLHSIDNNDRYETIVQYALQLLIIQHVHLVK